MTTFWATFLAVRNLAHNKIRTVVALAGVGFAVTLLFMQLGFLASVSLLAMLVYDSLEFDLVLTSPNYVMLTRAGTIPQRRLTQAKAHEEVEAVRPLYVNRQKWRNPQSHQDNSVVVLGINPSDPVTLVPELEQHRPTLALPDTVLMDRLSRSEIGPRDVGLVTQVGPRNLEIVGQFTIGPGFETGLIVVSDQTFSRLFGGSSLHDVNLGLIKLRPGADAEKVAAELRQMLPADVCVMTRKQLETQEEKYWVRSTSTGIIFGSGVIVALLFGLVITYQVLSLEVTHRQAEYATLKALGFSDVFLSFIVLQQAVLIAVLSFIPGYIVAQGIYTLCHVVTRLPIGMTWERLAIVFVLTLVICSLSGLRALRHLRRADPVDLFT